MLITLALVVGELTDARRRLWRAARPLTTDTVAGLLVLLIVTLAIVVVNYVITGALSPGRRSTSCVPISRSSSRTCMDRAGWVTAHSSAARPK